MLPQLGVQRPATDALDLAIPVGWVRDTDDGHGDDHVIDRADDAAVGLPDPVPVLTAERRSISFSERGIHAIETPRVAPGSGSSSHRPSPRFLAAASSVISIT